MSKCLICACTAVGSSEAETENHHDVQKRSVDDYNWQQLDEQLPLDE